MDDHAANRRDRLQLRQRRFGLRDRRQFRGALVRFGIGQGLEADFFRFHSLNKFGVRLHLQIAHVPAYKDGAVGICLCAKTTGAR